MKYLAIALIQIAYIAAVVFCMVRFSLWWGILLLVGFSTSFKEGD